MQEIPTSTNTTPFFVDVAIEDKSFKAPLLCKVINIRQLLDKTSLSSSAAYVWFSMTVLKLYPLHCRDNGVKLPEELAVRIEWQLVTNGRAFQILTPTEWKDTLECYGSSPLRLTAKLSSIPTDSVCGCCNRSINSLIQEQKTKAAETKQDPVGDKENVPATKEGEHDEGESSSGELVQTSSSDDSNDPEIRFVVVEEDKKRGWTPCDASAIDELYDLETGHRE